MKKNKNKFLLVLVLILALSIRVFPLVKMGFDGHLPFGQGGFYIKIAQQIAENNYRLPRVIPHYTLGGVPFAYPPLAFYLEAVLIKLGVPVFVVSSLLPAAFSFFSVVAFFFLAREIFGYQKTTYLATVIYTLMPSAFGEHLPGEGVVEAMGTTLFILCVLCFLKLSRQKSFKMTAWSGLVLGLALLSSPGGGYTALFIASFITLVSLKRDRRLIVLAGLPFLIALLVSGPFLFRVISNHGQGIFWLTLQDQYRRFFSHSLLDLMTLSAMNGKLVNVFTPFVVFGLLACLTDTKNLYLIFLLVLTYLIPREHVYLVPVFLSLLATKGVVFLTTSTKLKLVYRQGVFLVIWSTFLLGLLTAFIFSGSLTEKNIIDDRSLKAMKWVKDHLEAEAAIMVIGDEIEWFPQVSGRTVVNVMWGGEWEAGWPVADFSNEVDNCNDLICLENAAENYSIDFDYLYFGRPGELLKSVNSNHEWQRLYRYQDKYVFKRVR